MVGIHIGIVQIDLSIGTVKPSRLRLVTIGTTWTEYPLYGKIKMEQSDCSIFYLSYGLAYAKVMSYDILRKVMSGLRPRCGILI